MNTITKEHLINILDKQFGNDEYNYKNGMGNYNAHAQLSKQCQRDYKNIDLVTKSKFTKWASLDFEGRVFQPLQKVGEGITAKKPDYVCVYGSLVQKYSPIFY